MQPTIAPGDAAPFAAALAGTGVAVELWTHLASTASARRGPAFDRLRVGIGLFGARTGEAGWAGYGDTSVARDRAVVVLRSGYGDGFPKKMADGVDILSVGMQYTARVLHDGVDPRVLVVGLASQ